MPSNGKWNVDDHENIKWKTMRAGKYTTRQASRWMTLPTASQIMMHVTQDGEDDWAKNEKTIGPTDMDEEIEAPMGNGRNEQIEKWTHE